MQKIYRRNYNKNGTLHYLVYYFFYEIVDFALSKIIEQRIVLYGVFCNPLLYLFK